MVASTASELIGVEDIPVVRGVESYEEFFRREYRAVHGLAVVLSKSRPVAEELTQEAFLAAFRQWDRVGRLESPGGWVRRVVANRSVSTFRRATAEAKALLRLNSRADYPTAPMTTDGMDVWKEVRRLPRRQAQVIALTYLEDLPRREVAEILGLTEETVKTHLDRARRSLTARLRPRREDPDGH